MAEQPPIPPAPEAPPAGVHAPRKIVLPPHRARAHRPLSERAREWARRNLFASPGQIVMTLLSLALVGLIVAGLVWFVFFEANWRVITVNRWLLFAGGFPQEESWRLWLSVAVVFPLIGGAYGMWASLGRRDLLFIALSAAFLFFLMAHGGAGPSSSIWFTASLTLFFLGYLVCRRVPRETGPRRDLAVRALSALIALALPIVLAVLMAGGGARASEFGGFMLNLILAPVGIVGGLLLAVPLALGRASSLRAISWTCTAYIEVIRGAPLIGWLFVALFILEDIVSGPLIVRTMIVLAAFTAAYVAEYIRGGLQALPKGQTEAAQAVGLSRWRTLQTVVLPQALRVSIPPIVGQAIGLWKDTALISIILPLRELVGNSRAAIAQSEFIPDRIEVYAFAAIMFWIVAFMMSRISQRLERSLGLGER